MKLAIFSRKFDCVVGGVEKMVLNLAGELSLRGHQVTVFSLDLEEAASFYMWPVNVGWIKIGPIDPDLPASWLVRFQRCRLIRKHVKELEIDSIVGFQIGSFALAKFATIGLGIHSVAAERNAPTLFGYIRHGRFKRWIANYLLMQADVVSVQLNSQRNLYPKFIRRKIRVTPNSVVLHPDLIRALPISPTKTLLFVGRLTFQKNLSVLFYALKLVSQPIKLKVVGEGEDELNLRKLSVTLGLDVLFKPFTDDLKSEYLDADLFCLPSRWEGFPNVVGEALSFGVPVVGFRDCAGVSDLVIDGINGKLASGSDNPVTLAEAINAALSADWNPQQIVDSVREYSTLNFTVKWELALDPKRNVK